MHESSHVQGYPGRKLTSCFLLLWQCSTTQRIVFSCMFMLHATQLGQWRCGWRTSRSGPCHCQPNLQTWIPLKTSGMWSTGRWMVTSHQTKPSCLNFCARSGIKSPNGNVKDWPRACQDAWKLWLEIKGIPPNIDFWTFPKVKTLALCCLKMNMNLFSLH